MASSVGRRPGMTRRTVLGGGRAVTLTGAALVACGAPGGQTSPGPDGSPGVVAAGQPTAGRTLDKNQKDELLWLVVSSNAGARGEAYDAMTRRFNEQFPNVGVKQVSIGGSIEQTMQQLQVYLAGGERVDIVGVTPEYVPVYAERLRALKDLRTFLRVDAGMKESDHAEGVVDSHVWKGGLYALPVGIATNHACLNLDLLDQAGIARPGPDWTIDQALDIARRTTVRRGSDEESTWGLYQWWQGVPRFIYSWIRGNGGEPLTPNESPTTSRWATDAESRETVQWLVDLSHKVGVMPVTPVGGSWGTFREGRGVISVMETNNLWRNPPAEGTADFKWDVQHLPVMKRGRYYPNWAFSYGVSANTKNPDVAWEMLKQIVGPAGQTTWFQLAKFAPSVKSVLAGAYTQDKDQPNNKRAIVEGILASRPMPKSLHWVEINNVVAEVLTNVRAGTVSVNEGLADVDRRVTAAMQQR
jgi:multiple sugar transport system substrate-binding protein